jgi:hypothetical protein
MIRFNPNRIMMTEPLDPARYLGRATAGLLGTAAGRRTQKLELLKNIDRQQRSNCGGGRRPRHTFLCRASHVPWRALQQQALDRTSRSIDIRRGLDEPSFASYW